MAKAGALVTALDISQGMLEEGRKRHADIEFVHGSAEELPFDADSFDAVTISFGLRNVQHPRAALSEFLRVLKPGGRLVIPLAEDGDRNAQRLTVIEAAPGGFREQKLDAVRFVPLLPGLA